MMFIEYLGNAVMIPEDISPYKGVDQHGSVNPCKTTQQDDVIHQEADSLRPFIPVSNL